MYARYMTGIFIRGRERREGWMEGGRKRVVDRQALRQRER